MIFVRDEAFFNEDWTSLLHGAQFASNGKCFTGYVNTPEELVQVFESFKRVTGASSLLMSLNGCCLT